MARLVLNEARVFCKQKRREGSMRSIRNAFAYSDASEQRIEIRGTSRRETQMTTRKGEPMRLNTTLIALVATTLGGALPAFAQTSMTIEAEAMTLSSYAIENGNRIKLTSSSGSASKTFSGASGTYKMQVYVQ